MEWTRSETLCLASPRCTTCGGGGLVLNKRTQSLVPCGCVTRSIFRICFARWQDCASKDIIASPNLEFVSRRGRVWGRKDQEYLADFVLIAKRTLDPWHYDVFRFHFLMGGDGPSCCRKLRTNLGNFYHAVCRVEQRLGRAFRETTPYALYPLDEYFGGTTSRTVRHTADMLDSMDDFQKAGGPLRAPLASVRGER